MLPIRLCAIHVLLVVSALNLAALNSVAAEAKRGYLKAVTVAEPTRLDWIFAVSNQSLPEAPAAWLPGYDSTQQTYERFVPKAEPPAEGYPVVLFISPGNKPLGWDRWQGVCEQQGVIFASPFNAGNEVEPKQRVRLALDVLDDLRRQFPIDADRTYITGFSGGSRMALQIAFSLPELFGGAVGCGAGGQLRDEPWLRHRVIERLNVAFMTGETDFNRNEIERFRCPQLTDMGVTTKVWTEPKLGHNLAPAARMKEVFAWLETGVPQRRERSKQFEAFRISGDVTPTREEWSLLLLEEARSRLEKRATMFSGLMQLQGVRVRWSDLPAANKALSILELFERNPVKQWEEDDLAEQRKFLTAEARALTAYATGDLPQQYVAQRVEMLTSAIGLWELLAADQGNSPLGKEATTQVKLLKTRLAKEQK